MESEKPTMDVSFNDFSKLILEEYLGATDSLVAFTARVEGYTEEKALILVQSKPWDENKARACISTNPKLVLEERNTIYYQFRSYFSQENRIRLTFPVSEAEIDKYREQEMFVIRETPQDYQTITLPHLQKTPVSKLGWIHDIIEYRSETADLVLDDKDPDTGFVLVPDFKWDRSNLKALYLLAIVHRRDIATLRDLRGSHLPLLRNIRDKTLAIIKSKFGFSQTKIKSYVHYLPTFNHFHVHFVSADFLPPRGSNAVCKAHVLDDIIDNLVLDGEFYARANISIELGASHALAKDFGLSSS